MKNAVVARNYAEALLLAAEMRGAAARGSWKRWRSSTRYWWT